MSPGQKFMTWVGSDQIYFVQVWSGQPSLGFFPKQSQIFQFFSPCIKKDLIGLGQKEPMSQMGWLLNYCGAKICLGRDGSGPISTSHNQFVTNETFFIFEGAACSRWWRIKSWLSWQFHISFQSIHYSSFCR